MGCVTRWLEFIENCEAIFNKLLTILLDRVRGQQRADQLLLILEIKRPIKSAFDFLVLMYEGASVDSLQIDLS